jgi:hypothetical protein
MQAANPSTPPVDDREHRRHVRTFASIMLAVMVVALVSTMLVAGTEYFKVVVWMLVPGGLGIVRGIQMLQHPEQVGRIRGRQEIDRIIAREGIDAGAPAHIASAGICLVGTAAFAGLGVYLARTSKRARRAERILEQQLEALEKPGTAGLAPPRHVARGAQGPVT